MESDAARKTKSRSASHGTAFFSPAESS
jgi:hypothetical protein